MTENRVDDLRLHYGPDGKAHCDSTISEPALTMLLDDITCRPCFDSLLPSDALRARDEIIRSVKLTHELHGVRKRARALMDLVPEDEQNTVAAAVAFELRQVGIDIDQVAHDVVHPHHAHGPLMAIDVTELFRRMS